ncbi:MAG: hypothetical protein J6A04_06835 [Clostridia bacterium]|nr:hypothetical protein [Clostridia bacterium]
MSFVGIICAPKQEGYIKQVLNSNLCAENVIILKEDNIDNFKNITFETIAIFSNHADTFQKKEILPQMMEKTKYFVINADEDISQECMRSLKGNVITYGFNSKSTVTASSVNEESILICLQRTITNRMGKQMEPQEICIPYIEHKVNTLTIMGVVSVLFIYGKEQICWK